MAVRRFVLLLILVQLAGAAPSAEAGAGRIVKVLRHYLDLEGRHTLSPSLYERDAYQAQLRKHPEQCSALRFDVQWKARKTAGPELKLRLEVRGSRAYLSKPWVLERTVNRKGFGWTRWSSLELGGQDFKQLGEVVAWRATLWDGEECIAEQQSFLW